MDSLEKFVLYASMSVLVIFISAILISSKGLGYEINECQAVTSTFTEGRLGQLDNYTYQVYYVAGMWQFEPREIEIPYGAELDIFLTSKDVVHGFHLFEKNVNLMAVPGTINSINVKFTKRGVYDIVCHEYCGLGHQNMVAKIIVK